MIRVNILEENNEMIKHWETQITFYYIDNHWKFKLKMELKSFYYEGSNPQLNFRMYDKFTSI